MAANHWKRNLAVFLLSIIVCLFLFAGFVYYQLFYVRYGEEIDFSKLELYRHIPKVTSNIGRVHRNNLSELHLEIHHISKKDYLNYVVACKEAGFIVDANDYRESYSASNKEGHEIFIHREHSYMTVFFTISTECKELEWPNTTAARLIPAPESLYGWYFNNWDDYFGAYLAHITEEEFHRYVQACKEKGFTMDAEEEALEYRAYNEDGYFLEVILFLNEDHMFFRIRKLK